jgi:hypothetical protein
VKDRFWPTASKALSAFNGSQCRLNLTMNRMCPRTGCGRRRRRPLLTIKLCHGPDNAQKLMNPMTIYDCPYSNLVCHHFANRDLSIRGIVIAHSDHIASY